MVEVLSESTRRLDEGEKREGYLALPSVEHYLLIDSELRKVVCFRRSAAGFVREVYTEPNAVIALESIRAELPLADIYENVDLDASLEGLGSQG